MTTTLTRTEPAPRPVIDTGSALVRTVLVLIGCLLASLPLIGLFERSSWLLDAWVAMVLTLAPAALLRHRRAPRAWHVLPGVVLGLLWLTARFVDQHAVFGFLPTPTTLHDATTLAGGLGDVIRTSSVPIAPVAPAVFVLCLVMIVFTVAIDLLAVVARRAALAGIPMLVVYVVSGAIMRSSVHWLLFAGAAAGYLLMLTVNARDEFGRWGPLVPRAGEDGSRASLGVSGQRIGVLGIVCALALAALVPTKAGNSLSDVLGGGGGGGELFGFPDGGTQIDPFATLKGQLVEPRPTPLLEVHISGPRGVDPFYLRTVVLTQYDSAKQRWEQGDPGPAVVLRDDNYYSNPPTDTSALPRETVQQPDPSPEYLADSNDVAANAPPVTPPDFPASVQQLVSRLIAGKTTRYAQARAISDYFTDPANGFTYSLETKSGDSVSDVVNFLNNKSGYCQQYAATMAIMLQLAGIPSRVVLGYTHGPVVNGSFTVNSTNAHAWVEAYLPGAGWLPFDPTPNTGGAGGATTNLAWGPHPDTGAGSGGASAGSGAPSNNKTAGNQAQLNAGTASANVTAANGSSGHSRWPGWATVLVLVVLVVAAAVPALVRRRRRWQRLRAARDGDTDALWRELSATAEDLGYVWSAARTPRQVVRWLDEGDTAVEPLRTLAGAVEASRYAPAGEGGRATTAELVGDLRAVEAGLRSRRSRGARLRALLLPQSLRWPLPGQQHPR
jgi:transglutaminase-like putative cysteine protease